MVDGGFFTFSHENLDDIEAPRQIPRPEALEPLIRTALDELLFLFVHRIEGPDSGVCITRFHLDEKQQLTLPCNDIHLAAIATFEIPRQQRVTSSPQPRSTDSLAVITDPDAIAQTAISRCRAIGALVQRAETSDDDGDKGRNSEALQDASWCHILDAWQSQIPETPDPVPASADRA